jgi:hypothetical protein
MPENMAFQRLYLITDPILLPEICLLKNTDLMLAVELMSYKKSNQS